MAHINLGAILIGAQKSNPNIIKDGTARLRQISENNRTRKKQSETKETSTDKKPFTQADMREWEKKQR